jgi:DNA repair exonuclease SbcCD ATPase subunit
MFALHERFKDCAYIQDIHKQLNSVERKDDVERNGYKNRFMVALLSEQVKQLERELHEKTIVQKEQEKQMQLMQSVLQQVSPALQENERLKQVCADLVRMTEDKDAELKEEQKKRSRYLEDYQEQTKRIRIAIQEEVNAKHTETITAVQLFSQGKLSQNDMLDQMIVFLEKARLMNRCTTL